MESVSVRYIVDDAEQASAFYRDKLGFKVEMARPGFALLAKGALRLLLNEPGAGGAGTETSAGAKPRPGGWNRFQLSVDDLEEEVGRLRDAGATFRNEIVVGRGGKQVLLEDPSGNVIEIFEPSR